MLTPGDESDDEGTTTSEVLPPTTTRATDRPGDITVSVRQNHHQDQDRTTSFGYQTLK